VRQAVTSARRQLSGRHLVRTAVGVVLLGVGLVGLLMPILPGWLLIFAGLALLGIKLPFVERMKQRAREKIQAQPKA
jgi:hypothetical protein